MTYAQSFDLATPTGLEEANTIDEIIRNVKIALNERFTDILGVDLSSATDPQRVTKIVIPSAGMTIRNSSDAASLISITNSGASLASPTITGTMTATGATISGGTVAPTTLTVPNGTAITNASLTTPALVSAVLTTPALFDATLNNTTFTGTVTGISMNPTVYYSALSSSINIAYGSLTTVLTLSSVPAGTYLISALTNGRAYGSSGTVGMNAQIKVGGVEVASTVSYADATTQYTPCFQTTAVSTLTSSSNITLQVVAAGSGATPVLYGGASAQTFISATRIN